MVFKEQVCWGDVPINLVKNEPLSVLRCLLRLLRVTDNAHEELNVPLRTGPYTSLYKVKWAAITEACQNSRLSLLLELLAMRISSFENLCDDFQAAIALATKNDLPEVLAFLLGTSHGTKAIKSLRNKESTLGVPQSPQIGNLEVFGYTLLISTINSSLSQYKQDGSRTKIDIIFQLLSAGARLDDWTPFNLLFVTLMGVGFTEHMQCLLEYGILESLPLIWKNNHTFKHQLEHAKAYQWPSSRSLIFWSSFLPLSLAILGCRCDIADTLLLLPEIKDWPLRTERASALHLAILTHSLQLLMRLPIFCAEAEEPCRDIVLKHCQVTDFIHAHSDWPNILPVIKFLMEPDHLRVYATSNIAAALLEKQHRVS